MCQAPVGKVVEVADGRLVVEYRGNRRGLKSKIPDVREGDYVLFSVDIAVDKVDEEEAMFIMGQMK